MPRCHLRPLLSKDEILNSNIPLLPAKLGGMGGLAHARAQSCAGLVACACPKRYTCARAVTLADGVLGPERVPRPCTAAYARGGPCGRDLDEDAGEGQGDEGEGSKLVVGNA